MVVLGTAKNLGPGAKPAPFTLSEFAVPKNSGTRTKILAVPRAQNVIVSINVVLAPLNATLFLQ